MLKTILRDNRFVNPLVRNILRMLHRYTGMVEGLTNRYRIYGEVILDVNATSFKIYSRSDDFIANELYYGLGYEMGEFKLVKALIRRSNYFFDVGANTGIFSIYVARINPKLKVWSFEPHPSNFNRLLINIGKNHLTNIEVFSSALGSSEKEISFTVPADLSISTTSSANGLFTSNFHRIEYKTILVKQVSGDSILAELPITSKDIIKIDVEYYELEVLQGLERLLRLKRPLIILEILQYDNLIRQFPEMAKVIREDHANDIFSFMLSLDYHAFAIADYGVCAIDSLEGQSNRNFLFIPKKLTQRYFRFDEIGDALELVEW